jgi:hypothetical protein
MKMLNFLITGIIVSITAGSVFAQESKERGDTDYTNNRSQGEPKQDKNVNTAQQTPTKIIEYIPGTWVIEQVYKGKEDVTATDTLAKNESIEFNREGRYMSFLSSEKIDSGAYRINEDHAVLYLASEGDNEKPTAWSVWFDKDGKMTMRMKNDGNKEEPMSYVYRRSATETSSNRKD